MSRLPGRRRPPAEALPPLGRHERVVSWAATASGAAVVATPLGLWLPDAGRGAERLPWHLIDRAAWRDGALTVTPATDSGDGVLTDQPPRTVRLAEPRDLPQTVRVRVQRAIAFTRHHPLPSGGGVRVVGRRVPGRDGLSWQLVFDPGVDRDDPQVRARAAALIEQARVEVGV